MLSLVTRIAILALVIILIALGLVFLLDDGKAKADHDPGHIPTPPQKCQGSDLHIKVHPDHITFIGNKWPVEHSDPEQDYYNWAEYIKVRYPLLNATTIDLHRVAKVRDNKQCLAYEVRGRVEYEGQNRIWVSTFEAETGDWGGRGWYRHLPSRL